MNRQSPMNREASLDEIVAELSRPLARGSAPAGSRQRDILRAVDEGRKVGRTAPVGVKPRDERAMRRANGLLGGSRLKAKDLIGFLFTHFAHARRRTLPRCRIELHVLTPSGRPAVEILSEKA